MDHLVGRQFQRGLSHYQSQDGCLWHMLSMLSEEFMTNFRFSCIDFHICTILLLSYMNYFVGYVTSSDDNVFWLFESVP